MLRAYVNRVSEGPSGPTAIRYALGEGRRTVVGRVVVVVTTVAPGTTDVTVCVAVTVVRGVVVEVAVS